MTNTCKIDGKIEEITKLMSESKSNTESLQKRLDELTKERDDSLKDDFVIDVEKTCEFFMYPNLNVKSPTPNEQNYIVSYTRHHPTTIIGTFLGSVVSRNNKNIKFVKEEFGRVQVYIK